MIKLTQVQAQGADYVLTFEYSDGESTKQVSVNKDDFADRFRAFKQLMGRNPGAKELKDIIVKMVNDHRRAEAVLLPVTDWSSLINTDLET